MIVHIKCKGCKNHFVAGTEENPLLTKLYIPKGWKIVVSKDGEIIEWKCPDPLCPKN